MKTQSILCAREDDENAIQNINKRIKVTYHLLFGQRRQF